MVYWRRDFVKWFFSKNENKGTKEEIKRKIEVGTERQRVGKRRKAKIFPKLIANKKVMIIWYIVTFYQKL